MADKEEILKLKDGEKHTVFESDYGKAEIWCCNETYFLFSIPNFGGLPIFEEAFSLSRIDDLISTYKSWC